MALILNTRLSTACNTVWNLDWILLDLFKFSFLSIYKFIMGNIGGKVVRKTMRPFKNFAVEARTERILAKEKPTPAPWHSKTQEKINDLMKSNFLFFNFK